MQDHKIVSQDEWISARKQFLAEEKEFTRLRDQLDQQRRDLPWVRVEKEYVFEGPRGKQTLADLFDGRSQLIVWHFMFDPSWQDGCPHCSRSGLMVTTASSRISISATSPWSPCRGRRSPSLKHFAGAWAGAFPGCRRSAATSTTIIKSHSHPSR